MVLHCVVTGNIGREQFRHLHPLFEIPTRCNMAVSWFLIPVALVGWVALKCFYNIYLHPLRSYPGPLLARASFLPYQHNLLRGRTHLWIQDVHRRYGTIVRLSPNELSFIEPEVWKDVYGHRASAFTKSTYFYGPDVHGDPPGILRADNTAHARQRKTISHAFSDKALKEQEQLLKGYVRLLVDKLKDVAASQLQTNIVEWYNFTTFDIMADLTFGESLHQLTDSSYHPWVGAIFSHIKLVSISRVCREWPGLTRLLQALLPRDAKEKRMKHLQFCADMLDKRMARKTERPDIWTFLQRGELQPTELRSNGALFMLAGTETTATELAGLTFMLLKNPEKLQRLTDEIRTSFSSIEDMDLISLSRLEYLGACIEEGLRLYPPVAAGLGRITPQVGATVCSRWIPGGTTVQVPIFSIHRSPVNFKNPESFKPERFLAEGNDTYGSDRKDAMNPFSTGPRNCVGKNLAYHEMRMVLASVLFHFDFELCDTIKDWLNQDVHTLWHKRPLMVKLRKV